MVDFRKRLAEWTGMTSLTNNVAECNQYRNTSAKPFLAGVGIYPFVCKHFHLP